ncbi:MAG: WYL domain-containing protein [Nitrospira sp.]|nr:WYL domain-containing protein [bacterium]MBL7048500.1 WYL domain-containing protein [Nitrospira sp.]
MGDKFHLERFIWFHNKVRSGRFPNARHIAERFEISYRTAQRTIEFMRDRIHAPLEYDYTGKGYYYSDSTYELPSLWLNEDSIIALSLAVRLASSIPDSDIKKQLCALLQELFRQQSFDNALSFKDIAENISVKNIEYSRVNEKHFTKVVTALFQKSPLDITYCSPHSGTSTQRTIMPLHLIQYMGSWQIIAFCALRNGVRNFALSRIQTIERTSEKISLPDNIPPMKEYTRKHFGIIQGGKTHKVTLQFSPSIAPLIQEQIWHPEQIITSKKDGSLLMQLHAADFKELIKRILSHGPNVKVISPKALVEEVKGAIERMGKVY